ncbi:hypothetical protein P8V03_14545 [Clostridium sp. A1-XYC3]|uniref:Uncharacterized protein n=1 Tax=Clostridium tanneri TaxID=3037988 RepID=A0ABU4JW82_9CLOT|nr:hypothetical protein [Clostridium sp. A1-XYC3]MDW8802366.1 hypothetical protein [Clostridium sp. A1-XYC3]
MSKQMEIIQALNVKPEINAKKEIQSRIDFLKAYCMKAGAKGFVFGIVKVYTNATGEPISFL